MVFANGNFWGRTIYACGTSDDFSRYDRFGPFEKSHYMVDYNEINALEKVLQNDSDIVGVFLEPIQGENGVKIPDTGYLTEVQNLCKKYNALFIVDEIQTGLGRTGFSYYCESENLQPDILLLGKSLSGGLYPVSAVLSSKAIMDVIKPGDHGSTYGGNPLAAAITLSALSQMVNENLASNANKLGMLFAVLLKELENNKFIKEIRGRGLMYAIELWEDCGVNAYDLSLWLMERGILCKPTKTNTLRLSPPLVINSDELIKAADIIISVFNSMENVFQYSPNAKVKYNVIMPDPSSIENIQKSRLDQKIQKPTQTIQVTHATETIAQKITHGVVDTVKAAGDFLFGTKEQEPQHPIYQINSEVKRLDNTSSLDSNEQVNAETTPTKSEPRILKHGGIINLNSLEDIDGVKDQESERQQETDKLDEQMRILRESGNKI